MLQLQDLNVTIEDQSIQLLHSLNLEINKGSITVLMGPNGAGKSSLVQSIMGNPQYGVEGKIIFEGEEIQELEPQEKAQRGIFLSFQQPVELPGVTQLLYLRTVVEKFKGVKIKPKQFREQLNEALTFLDMKSDFNKRDMNVGFSGGEKKKNELLQLLLLEPKLAILDEIDSGIDVDGLKTIAKVIAHLQEKCNTTFVIVSHHEFLLKHLNITNVVVLDDGKVAKQGDKELGLSILENGFKGKKIE